MWADLWQDWPEKVGVSRGELKPFPAAFSFRHLERLFPGRLCDLAIYDSRHSYPLTLGHSLLRRSCGPGGPSPNTPPQWPRTCSSQKPLQSRSLSSPYPQARSASFPGTPHPKQEHCLSLSCELPSASPKVRSCLGTELFWNSPSPWGRRSSSVRQEKLVPWSSLRANTVAVTSATGVPSAGCRLSNFSP